MACNRGVRRKEGYEQRREQTETASLHPSKAMIDSILSIIHIDHNYILSIKCCCLGGYVLSQKYLKI